jgi:hypothetical protein
MVFTVRKMLVMLLEVLQMAKMQPRVLMAKMQSRVPMAMRISKRPIPGVSVCDPRLYSC